MSRMALKSMRTLGVVAALLFVFQVIQPQSAFATPATTLTIQKSVAVDSGSFGPTGVASAGSQLTYRLQFTNGVGSMATNVRVTDTLAAGQLLVAASLGCSSAIVAGSTVVTCGPLDVAMGASGFFTIFTQVQSGAPSPITNTATITADNAATQTSSPATSVTVTGSTATSQLQKFVSEDGSAFSTSTTAAPGDQLTYDIQYTNLSNASQSSVVITDTLQAGQTLFNPPATSGFCTSFNSGLLTCPIGTVPAQTTVHVRVQTAINSTFSGTILNTAQATIGGTTVSSNTTTVQVGTPAPGFTGTFTLCGQVTSYTAGASITISGITVPIVAGTIPSGSIAFGFNECVSFTLNGAGQATALVSSSNLAGVGVVCGIYQPTNNFSVISVSGVAVTVQSGMSAAGVLIPGGFYCFLITPQGVAFAVLTGIPTTATQLHATVGGSPIHREMPL